MDRPCDVDRLCGRDDWGIYELGMVVTPGGCDYIQLTFEKVVYVAVEVLGVSTRVDHRICTRGL